MGVDGKTFTPFFMVSIVAICWNAPLDENKIFCEMRHWYRCK